MTPTIPPPLLGPPVKALISRDRLVPTVNKKKVRKVTYTSTLRTIEGEVSETVDRLSEVGSI